jgi:hypothetical protein
MSNLATIRDRVEQQLVDTGNSIWSADLIDEGLRQALAEFSLAIPLHAITTLTLSSDTRELDISTISGLLDVVALWLPYTAADPEYPPNTRPFEHWRDNDILYLGEYEGQSGDVARVFYTAVQTIEDLDSAAATTLTGPQESILITGGAGFAASSRSLDLEEQVTLGARVAKEIQAWGEMRLERFRSQVAAEARRLALAGQSAVELPPLDRWDRDGQGWS